MQFNRYTLRTTLSPFHSFNLRGSLTLIIFIYYILYAFINLNLIILKNSFFRVIFSIICVLNLRGMIPFRWALTSYIWSNLLLSCFLWAIFMGTIILKDLNYFLSWFLPQNSPKFLWILLVVLEVLRQVIRPLTLRLRLACNLITGHVLLALVCRLSSVYMTFFTMIFETIVLVIQASVYSLLVSLYLQEVS